MYGAEYQQALMALVAGFLGSGHCIGMCGPIVAALALAIYLVAPRLAETIPALEPALSAYVGLVNATGLNIGDSLYEIESVARAAFTFSWLCGSINSTSVSS